MNNNSKKKKVFISYAREDIEVAERLYSDLNNAGLKPWMDEKDLLPGQNWELTVTNAIRKSSFFWGIYFDYGHVGWYDVKSNYYVRAVRSRTMLAI
ncbi:MAG: TIR domain-containing protein [Desulfobacteraceae bacterium]|nr:TIR domain-containing protein [Desulfobacteraceae bacterium]